MLNVGIATDFIGRHRNYGSWRWSIGLAPRILEANQEAYHMVLSAKDLKEEKIRFYIEPANRVYTYEKLPEKMNKGFIEPQFREAGYADLKGLLDEITQLNETLGDKAATVHFEGRAQFEVAGGGPSDKGNGVRMSFRASLEGYSRQGTLDLAILLLTRETKRVRLVDLTFARESNRDVDGGARISRNQTIHFHYPS